jgi:hypothetical protein
MAVPGRSSGWGGWAISHRVERGPRVDNRDPVAGPPRWIVGCSRCARPVLRANSVWAVS